MAGIMELRWRRPGNDAIFSSNLLECMNNASAAPAKARIYGGGTWKCGRRLIEKPIKE